MFFYYQIAVLSVLLYLHGFFPVPSRPSHDSQPNIVTSLNPTYDRAVIIIIDALRLDFVQPTTMPFLTKAFKKSGCFSHLKVEMPTVTLPRIKAITTGNVAQFVDIILNFANPAVVEDSIIHRVYDRGKKIVFYGDDLWVKLFGKMFLRSEGTCSFFVNDFTEVDDNVTRNVKLEIQKSDWDFMLLHYLGLDHIGHVYGPRSSLILTKLKEMDTIVEEIYENSNNKTLFIITSDHGMRDSGGHGSSTFPETNVPMIFLNMPHCKNDTFNQIDIPVNLAILFGFDIPSTSIGQLQHSLINHLPDDYYIEAWRYNLQTLRAKKKLCNHEIEIADHLFDLFKINKNQTFKKNITKIYQTCSMKISDELLESSIQQNTFSLILAGLIVASIVLKILNYLLNIEIKSDYQHFIFAIMILFQFSNLNFYLNSVNLILALFFIYKNVETLELHSFKSMSFLLVMSSIHPWIFSSSSFLEEENEFWYFIASTFIILNITKGGVTHWQQWLAALIVIRFIQLINQVGDKWASLPDLSDWLFLEENYLFLQILFTFALILIMYSCTLFSKSYYTKSMQIVILVVIYIFRLTGSIMLGQIIWYLIFANFFLSILLREDFLTTWLLVVALLLKPNNSILVPACVFVSQIFHKVLNGNNLIMGHWWLGNLLFFAQGHDNSLASVDISTGYIGLTEYNPILVFPQVLCHTYALPVLSHLLLFTNRQVNVFKSFSLFVLFRLYTVLIVFLITFLQRHHLFIFSVFAPKMFVEASHLIFLVMEINCYYLNTLIKTIF